MNTGRLLAQDAYGRMRNALRGAHAPVERRWWEKKVARSPLPDAMRFETPSGVLFLTLDRNGDLIVRARGAAEMTAYVQSFVSTRHRRWDPDERGWRIARAKAIQVLEDLYQDRDTLTLRS